MRSFGGWRGAMERYNGPRETVSDHGPLDIDGNVGESY